MDESIRMQLKDIVNKLLELDGLEENEFNTILQICRKATNRNIANLTEEYLIGQIEDDQKSE